MKWPENLMLIRHDISAYNVLKDKKQKDSLYQEFLARWKDNPTGDLCKELAKKVQNKFSLDVSDAETPLADVHGQRAYEAGLVMSKEFEIPHIVYVSPYLRTLETLKHLQRGWLKLQNVKVLSDDRIREQDHGLALLYNDWRVFQVLHPDQEALHKLEGEYWYRYPQGENIPDVRLRNLSWISTITREFAEKRVLVVTHHLNILATRANFERLNVKEFIRLDKEEKPKNCGVTLYEGNPNQGKNGKLNLKFYNHTY